MAAKPPIHITVTGAAGQIGYALLFRIASGQLLGPDQPVVLRLLEIEPGMKALEGVVMEVDDCAFPLVSDIITTTDLDVAFDGTSWALLVGSVPRKAGMERGDLLTINGGIFGPQGRAIAANAASDIRVVVVGNPCNTNCLIARSNAPEVPTDRWFAMTRLDENRAKSQLAKRAGVPVSSVTNLAIWGNHSATQFPDFANARIDGTPARLASWLLARFSSSRVMANQRSVGTSGAFERAIRQLVLHGLPTTTTRMSEAAFAAMARPWGPKIPPLMVSRSPRSIPALRGTEPTNSAHEVPSKATSRSVVVMMSLTRGNAQSSTSMTTPSRAFIPGSISRRRNTTGWSGPSS